MDYGITVTVLLTLLGGAELARTTAMKPRFPGASRRRRPGWGSIQGNPGVSAALAGSADAKKDKILRQVHGGNRIAKGHGARREHQ